MNKLFRIVILSFFGILIIGIIHSGYKYIQELKNNSEAKATSPDYGDWLYVKKGTLQKDNNCIKFIETSSNEQITMCGTYSLKGLK
jgi:hypothetical protein